MRLEDKAQEIELAEYEATQQRAIAAEPDGESAKRCIDPHCGEPIPEDRRQALPGVQFCADCAERREYEQRQRGKR